MIDRAVAGVVLLAWASAAPAAETGCGQMLVDTTTPPETTSFITPPVPATPFYQWENNYGYCGEVSLMQAGLAHGQWMSQLDARLICGTGLSQTGPNGACAAHHNQTNYNAQLLIEDPGTGVSGPGTYANAALCMANARLAGSTYPYESQPAGMAGYQQYMSWVKAQVISGQQVTVGVLINGGTDKQYDHEVAVLRIGTNHAVTDPAYHADDVLYFDDHGAYTLNGKALSNYPAIPRGAGGDTTGCTPYVYGYSFAELANTRAGANRANAIAYSIIIPGAQSIHTYTGGSGYAPVTINGPHDYAFSVAGPMDEDGETLPVSLDITGPTQTGGVNNPADPVAGYNYENPHIGTPNSGNACTNAPAAAMTHFGLRATVRRLTPGVAYNLYQYNLPPVSGTGSAAALAVPTGGFNQNAAMASNVTHFIASGSTFSRALSTVSNTVVVFRCVPASSP